MTSKPRVLCIDDDVDSVEMLTMLLPTRGLEAEGFSVAREAIASFNDGITDESRRFDAVICDIDLRRISGLTILKLIRASVPQIPFFILSGYGCITMRGLARAAGATDFFEKPIVNTKRFLDRIEKVTREYHALPKQPGSVVVFPLIVEEMIARYDHKLGLAATG